MAVTFYLGRLIMKKILIVEDDQYIRELLRYNLEKETFNVIEAKDGAEGLESFFLESPDLILLDLMLPKVNGIEVCRKIKESAAGSHVQIIMISAKGEEADIVFGLGVGADDYLIKPFSIKELIARIYTRLRNRPSLESNETEKVKTEKSQFLRIDYQRYQVFVDNKMLPLTLTEFKLLTFLCDRPHVVLTRDTLLDVIGKDINVIDRNVDVHILSIRRKLGKYRHTIRTIRGVGYAYEVDL